MMSDSTSLHRKLGLGTVQFGMDYGVANHSGRVSGNQLEKIMELARSNGIDLFDTAPAYEKSEAVLGQCLDGNNNIRIITKTPHFLSRKTTAADGVLLRSTFDQSLERLRVDSVYGLLLHRSADLLRPNSRLLWTELENLKAQGKVQRLGVSVYTPEELSRVLDKFPVDIVQLPMNILDQRFRECGLLKQLDEVGIEVHVRSAFLQGVLVTEPRQLPEYFAPLRPHLMSLKQVATKSGISMLALALNYVLHLSEVDTVLVGVDSEPQFREILNSVQTRVPTDLDWDHWAVNESRWVNPNEWKLGCK